MTAMSTDSLDHAVVAAAVTDALRQLAGDGTPGITVKME